MITHTIAKYPTHGRKPNAKPTTQRIATKPTTITVAMPIHAVANKALATSLFIMPEQAGESPFRFDVVGERCVSGPQLVIVVGEGTNPRVGGGGIEPSRKVGYTLMKP